MAGRIERPSVRQDRAAVGSEQAGEQIEDRGLAGAGWADEADEAARLDREVESVQHHERATVRAPELFLHATDVEPH